jgi:branched-chain amino acid transport system ATP-binding protein
MAEPILRVERLRKSFGGLRAVDDVSFSIEPGGITGLIGPNGSGKTTLFNIITGVLPPDGGQVYLDGTAIGGWAPHRITALGLARTFQISRIFGQMTVWENMMVVAHGRPEQTAREQAADLLERVNLYEAREKFGADLSFGQHRLLEFVRLLMLEPRVIMLDEPFAGVNPTMRNTMVDLIHAQHDAGRTLLLIDHAMTIIMSLCERILVLDMGALIADGPPAAIQADERVLEAYFGKQRGPMGPRPEDARAVSPSGPHAEGIGRA